MGQLDDIRELGRQVRAANRFTATKVIAPAVVADELDSADLAEVESLFVEFEQLVAGKAVVAGDIRTLDGQLIEIIQPHTPLQNWIDTRDASLYKVHHVDGAPWHPSAGGHDVYAMGAIVTHNGARWRSKHAANSWEPGAPGSEALWEQVE